MTYRRFSSRRRGVRAGLLLALVAAALGALGAGALAQEGSQTGGPRLVATGVTVGGLDLSGLSRAEAEATLAEAFAAPLVLRHRGERWRFLPQTLGASANVEQAARAALAARPGAELPLPVRVRRGRYAAWAREFAADFERRVRSSRIVLRGLRPVARRERPGRRLDASTMEARIARALGRGGRAPIALAVHTSEPRAPRAGVDSAIVIRRGSNRLFFYRGSGPKGLRLAREFGVATGQAAYPTPLGRFTIVTRQRDPWWYPPDSDWAAGALPVPPGPGNPLGTRWMGLSEPLVGIHGTPDEASIGYSASHGCIRMRIPEVEWLFEQVETGIPVFVLPA